MIDFADVPAQVGNNKRSFFESVVSVKDRGQLARNPGRFARILRQDEGGRNMPFTRREVAKLTQYGARHSYRVKTRLDKTLPGRWHVWIAFDPQLTEHSEDLAQRRRIDARRRATTREDAA